MNDRRPLARDAGLVAVVFVATLILLAGLAIGLAGRAPAGSGGSVAGGASPTVSGASSPAIPGSPGPSTAATDGSPGGQPSAGTDPVLVGAGDIADCGSSGDEATAALLDGISGTVFTAGDNAYPDGTAEQFATCYDSSWGRFKARTRPTIGNHDWLTKDAAGYLGYFGSAATNADGRTWYSYDLGRWHVIALDSNCAEIDGCGSDSPEGRWLAADLAASKARCTVAIWHHPRFSSGEHGNDTAVAPFWEALYKAGIDVVVNGHDHDYEVFKPQTPAGAVDVERGIREFVVGTGGEPLRAFTQIQPNSELRAAIGPGVLKLTLHADGYDWLFVSSAGDFSNSGSGTCH